MGPARGLEARGQGCRTLRARYPHQLRDPLVVLLSATTYMAGAGDAHQASVAEHLQMMADVALVGADARGELADRRRPIQFEEQPLPGRMPERLEVFSGRDVHHPVGHGLSVEDY